MAQKHHFPPLIAIIPILLLLLNFTIPSLADSPPTNSTSANLCRDAPDPSYCRSVVPTRSANAYDSARQCVRNSLYQSRKFLNLINNYLSRQSSLQLSTTAVRALEDCRFLATLNIDFLLNSLQTIKNLNTTLPSGQADDMQTFLSAILTNQQTCFEGMQDASASWSVKNGISVPSSNDTKLYSVSLALSTKLWVPRGKTRRWKPKGRRFPFRSGKLPMKMSSRNRQIYESVSKRKLLQDDFISEVLVSDVVTVSLDGSGNFSSINDAIAFAPNNTNGANGYFMIYVTAGVYREYVSIAKNKRNLLILGDGINRTIITGNRSVVDGWTTFESATFAVVSPNFTAVNITIRNTAGPEKHQAVALRNGADLSVFYRCSFEGYQDTLYTHSLRQFYRECDVYGTVDFIFGNAAVVLQNCNLYPRQPTKGQFNSITAQGRTDPNQNTGTSIHNCKIRATADLASSNFTVNTYLGRPWKEYSRVVYMQSFMDSLINPSGWSIWNGDFALNTSYYAEFANTGPGSDTSKRVTWPGFHRINATDAANFTVSNFILGNSWLPQTGAPYIADLL